MAIQQRNLESLSHFTPLATTSISATGAQSSVDMQGYDGDVVLVLNGTAGGAGSDITFTVEHSTASDGSGDAFAAIPTTAGVAAFAAIGNAAFKEVKVINVGQCKRYLRLNCTTRTAGTSSVTCNGFGVLKYQ